MPDLSSDLAFGLLRVYGPIILNFGWQKIALSEHYNRAWFENYRYVISKRGIFEPILPMESNKLYEGLTSLHACYMVHTSTMRRSEKLSVTVLLKKTGILTPLFIILLKTCPVGTPKLMLAFVLCCPILKTRSFIDVAFRFLIAVLAFSTLKPDSQKIPS